MLERSQERGKMICGGLRLLGLHGLICKMLSCVLRLRIRLFRGNKVYGEGKVDEVEPRSNYISKLDLEEAQDWYSLWLSWFPSLFIQYYMCIYVYISRLQPILTHCLTSLLPYLFL